MLWLIVKCQIWAFNKWIRLGQQREMKVSQFISILEIVSPGIIDSLTGSLISGGREWLLGAQCWFSGHIWASLGNDSGMDWWWLPGREKRGWRRDGSHLPSWVLPNFKSSERCTSFECGARCSMWSRIPGFWSLPSAQAASMLLVSTRKIQSLMKYLLRT